jgi:hypothetical protein
MMYWRSGGIAPRILNLSTKWGQGSASCTGRFTPQGKNPRYPLDSRLGGPQRQSGRGGEEKTPHNCPCQELNADRPTRSLVTIPTELLRTLAVNLCFQTN